MSRNQREGRYCGHAAGKAVRRGKPALLKWVRSARARAVLRYRAAMRRRIPLVVSHMRDQQGAP
jgi:hypothetical protein